MLYGETNHNNCKIKNKFKSPKYCHRKSKLINEFSKSFRIQMEECTYYIGLEKSNIVKIIILPQSNLWLKAISYLFSNALITIPGEYKNLTIYIPLKPQETSNLEKKKCDWRNQNFLTSDYITKLHSLSSSILFKALNTDQWNKTESLEINLYTYRLHTADKTNKTTQWKTVTSINKVLRKTGQLYC